MWRSCVYATILASICGTLVSATDITGQVEWNAVLPKSTPLNPNTRVTLNHTAASTFLRQDGSFVLRNVEPGTHILEVLCDAYLFEPILISLSNTTIHLQPYVPNRLPLPVTPQLSSLPYPIVLRPLAQYEFYESPAGLNVLGMLKNPMVLMMLFTVAMTFGMPKMIAMMDLDPEEVKQMTDMRNKATDFTNTDWSEKLAGAISGTAAASTPSTAKAVGNGGGGKKKRK